MNAHQRRKDRRQLDRFGSAAAESIVADMIAHQDYRREIVARDRSVLGPALRELLAEALPPELRHLAPTVEWKP